MSEDKKEEPENPLAFPSPYTDITGELNSTDGMTLRDYFAAKAMQARIINMGVHYHENEMEVSECISETAKRAYQVADAMLKERSK